MPTYIAEQDPEFEGQALVVREPGQGEQHGTVVGWCSGLSAMENAWSIAGLLRQRRGAQPDEDTCDRMGYTPREEMT